MSKGWRRVVSTVHTKEYGGIRIDLSNDKGFVLTMDESIKTPENEADIDHLIDQMMKRLRGLIGQ